MKVPRSCKAVPLFDLTQAHVDRDWEGSMTVGKLVGKVSMPSGKQAVLVILTPRHPTQEDRTPTPSLSCSCEYHAQVMDTDKRTSCMWMDKCEAKEMLRRVYVGDISSYYSSGEWATRSIKEKILDIFARVKKGQYLGQGQGEMIYVQEVAPLLGVSVGEVLRACHELFAEEKLDLNGMILTDYIPRFRFPKEIQSLLGHMIEEPLGWPNGDAGDIFIHTLESAINDHTHYKSGRMAFTEENYPHIAPHHLVSFGLRWLSGGMTALKTNKVERDSLDLEALLKQLQGLVKEARKLSVIQQREKNK